jgi:RHS repeat-associated protein
MYDAAGRLSTTSAVPLSGVTRTITRGYNLATGQLSSVDGSWGEGLSFDYDGPLLTGLTWTGAVGGTAGASVILGYDDNFRVASQTVTGGTTLSIGYDNDGLLTSAGGMTVTRRSDNGMVAATTITATSGGSTGTVSDEYTYDLNGQLASYTASSTVGTTTKLLYSETIVTRDNAGRIKEKIDAYGYTGATESHDWQYDYDTAGRLTQAKEDGVVTGSYGYDDDDNRIAATVGGTVISPLSAASYDAQDRMTAYGGATYAYGANGELATKTVSGAVTSYTYDAFGNLLDVTPPTGSAVDYVIDGLNRRVGRKVGGSLVQGLLYKDQLNSVAELDGTGALIAQYIYGTKANVPDLRIDAAGNVYRVLSDHLGSPRLVVKVSDGTTAERMDFDEFGNEAITAGATISVPFGFAGGLADPQTGLVRFGARDYDPTTGRWVSKDPIRFAAGQANIYEYAASNPVGTIDPNGMDANSCPTSSIQCCINGQTPANDNCIECFPSSDNCAQQCSGYLGPGECYRGKDGWNYCNDRTGQHAYQRCFSECKGYL